MGNWFYLTHTHTHTTLDGWKKNKINKNGKTHTSPPFYYYYLFSLPSLIRKIIKNIRLSPKIHQISLSSHFLPCLWLQTNFCWQLSLPSFSFLGNMPSSSVGVSSSMSAHPQAFCQFADFTGWNVDVKQRCQGETHFC